MGKVPATVSSDSGQEALRSPPQIARAKQLRTSRATPHLRAMHVVLFISLPVFFNWAPESISRLYKYATWMASCALMGFNIDSRIRDWMPLYCLPGHPSHPLLLLFFFHCVLSLSFTVHLVAALWSGGRRGPSDRFAAPSWSLTSRQKDRPLVP